MHFRNLRLCKCTLDQVHACIITTYLCTYVLMQLYERFLLIFQNFKAEISTELEAYIQDICNCTVTLTNANLICVNATSALYTIQLTDQNSTLSIFLYELLNVLIMNDGINLDIAIIRTWTVMEEYTDNSSNKNASSDWHLYLLLTIIFILLVYFISYSYYRYVRIYNMYVAN